MTLLLLTCVVAPMSAQVVHPNRIYLKGQTINANNNIHDWVAHQQNVKFPAQVLLQFKSLPDEESKAQLKQVGVELMGYIPDRTYTAIVQHQLTSDFFELNNINYVAEVSAGLKVADDVSQALSSNNKYIELNVSIAETATQQNVETLLSSVGGKLLSDRRDAMGYIVVSIPKLYLGQLQSSYFVKYIGLHQQEVPLNLATKSITRMQAASAPLNIGGYNLSGNGVTIGIGDNYSGIDHVDLQDRVINYTASSYDYHGLHISGIAAAAGIMDEKGRGAAPAALLSSHFFSGVLSATPSIFQSQNVTITNNSYSARFGSCDYTGTYDNLSSGVDGLSNAFSEVLHVFAAANNGRFDCAPYPKGYGTIAGGYQVAKNGLVVTSCDKEFVNAESGSRGPVLDGRLKPEIATVGVGVYSTTNTDEYFYALGTSMASPNVAGAAALLTERYKQLKGNINPRADLLKALLINGSTDIGTKGPDYRFGFGFLNMAHSLTMLDSNQYFERSITNGAEQTETILVPAGLKRLKVLLYWHDVPANTMASKQLVNDLDLTVTTPTNTTRLPLVLNSNPSNILDEAKEAADHLNNCEQVTIDNPAAGNYTLKVKGGIVPSGSRRYILAYDFEEDKIELQYPRTHAHVLAGDTLFVYWDAYDEGNNYTLEYSINNGAAWTVLDNNIASNKKHYLWIVPENISSGECLMRISRNNTSQTHTSGRFAITPKLNVKLSDNQCPGYMQIEWNAIPNAPAYEILWKQGYGMVSVDTVASLNHIFSGLQTSQMYYAAVRPIIDGIGGYRSVAVKRMPNDGNCAGNISDFDLKIEDVVNPKSGRLYTSTALTNNEDLSVNIYNLDDAACTSYKLSYRINGGAWVSQTFNDNIDAIEQKTVTLSGLDLQAIGDYTIDIAVENLANADPVSKNDSTTIYISQLDNPVLTLDVIDDFEGVSIFSITNDSIGIGTNRRWDYRASSKNGRLRNHVLGSIDIEGGRSISLDAIRNNSGTKNHFSGTYNLSNYNANTDELRLEFDYMIHGVPRNREDENDVTVRGVDTKPLQRIYQYDLQPQNIGTRINSGSLSLSDLMLANGDNFSSSTQVQFNQSDTSVISRSNFGHGVTIDNVRVYTVQNDLQLLSINAPQSLSCGVTGPLPLTVTIRNGVAQTLNNIQLNYRLDNGAVITESLSSISGKQTLQYTFSKNIDITRSGSHLIDVWVVATGDSYNKNDSINNYILRNQPLITQFPYYEDFESSDGFWYTDGINNSWEYGQPSGQKIANAASGSKAWVTNLDGNYNDYEGSYLYSPCFDIAGLDNPTLSFQLAEDIENCGTVNCDGAFMEFSTNGFDWKRLGGFREGENWYVDSNYLVWNTQDRGDWRQSKIGLPDSLSSIQLRYVLYTDPGGTFEGIGVDDVRIFNERIYLGTDDVISISPNPTTDGRVCIEWAANSGKQMQLVITDITGKAVYKTSATAVQGYNKTCVQTPMFSSGMYFMRIIIGNKEHKRKLVYIRK